MKTLSRAACKGSVFICVLFYIAAVGGILAATFLTISYERSVLLRQQEVVRAEAAVQAALAAAQSLLCGAITQYPDSASVWEESLPGLETSGTSLYILKRTDPCKSARLLVLPLVSGVQEPCELGQNPFQILPEICDFNRLFSLQSTHAESVPVCAPWVQLCAPNDGAPLLARYAFWLEDESFKLNIQQASLQSTRILEGATDITLQAIFSQFSDISQKIKKDRMRELAALRESLGEFHDLRISRSVLRFSTNQWNRWKFLCTVHSEALNLTRQGFARINIKKLFVPTPSVEGIRRQLDDFIAAVRRESPYFGQRFYRLYGVPLEDIHTVSKKHEEIYLNKLAVNVRDFLLPGSNPTRVLNADGYPVLAPIQLEVPRGENGLGLNPLAAIGKKRIPYLQEYAVVARLIDLEPSVEEDKKANGAKFEMTLDHFLEFWNLSDKPIRVSDLGSEPRLILRNQPEWDLHGKLHAGSGIPSANERIIDIPLRNFKSLQGKPLIFQPGKATVLTTYPELPPRDLFPQGAEFFVAPSLDQRKRKFSGITYRTKTEAGIRKYEVAMKLRNAGITDHETECLLVNQEGWIDGFGYLSILNCISMRYDNGHLEEDVLWYVRSCGLQGESNGGPDQIGDPRTLNDQLELGEKTIDTSKSVAMNPILTLQKNSLPHTRFLRNALSYPGNSSLGSVYSPFLKPEKWGDPLLDLAPAVFPEGAIKTIAELGHVFDPIIGPVEIERDRGGGRTLRIGQPEFYPSRKQQGIWSRDPLSPAREWTAWRLCDIFSVTDSFKLSGALNINGVLRADGAILRALLYDFRWERVGGSELGGCRLEEEDKDLLIQHFQKRLRGEHPYEYRGGPFFERGEISEIDLFQSEEPFPPTFSNPNYKGLVERKDRVREEIVRYLLEAITTRGNIFSVYCVGQAVRKTDSQSLRILATRKAKFTFRLVPFDLEGRRMDKDVHLFSGDYKRASTPFRYGVELLTKED